MFRTVVAAMMIAAIVGVAGLLLMPLVAAQGSPSAERSFDNMTVEPGADVQVTIAVSNYGGSGAISEMLPSGFTYKSSDLTRRGSGQVLAFILTGQTSLTYTATASSVEDDYTFSGVLKRVGETDFPIGGASMVTVEAASGSTPIATRSFDNMTVEPGADVQVTIAVSNYGGSGAISEMLPSGFTYKSSDLTRRGSGQVLAFILTGQTSLTYTATASSVEDDYTFSGVLKRVGETDFPIGGASMVTVEAASGSTPIATRSFDNMTVEPGADVQVTIAVSNYGGAGAISEMLPSGFTYKSSSLTRRGTGQELAFILTGQTSLTYTTTASSVERSHTFSGVLKRVGETDFPIGGASRVTVRTAETPPPSGNTAPAFRTAPVVSVPENTTTVTAVRATDRDSQDSVTGYEITGGADQDKFSLTNTRVLSFKIAPDFEAPTDAGADNRYMVEVTAASGTGSRERERSRTFTVTVTNEDEAGMVTLSPAQPVTGTALTAMLEDPDGETAMVEWQWASSDAMDGTFTDIRGATTASYTPREAVADDPATTDVDEAYAGDVGMYLQAMAMYNDGHGDDKSAMMVADNPVIAAPADMCIEPLGPLTGPQTRSGTWASGCDSQGQANNYARYYTFTLAEETRVAIYLTSGRDTYLYLREGEGRTGRVEHDNNNVGRGSINSRIEETLDAGDYTVEATTYYRSAVTGTFTLDVRPVVRVQELGPLTETYTTPGTWSDDFVSERQAPNYARYYEFTLETPTDLRIDLTSERDTYLYLVREDGTVVQENNNVGRSINSRIVQMALAAGTYTVEATTYYRNPVTGNFVLNIGLTR